MFFSHFVFCFAIELSLSALLLTLIFLSRLLHIHPLCGPLWNFSFFHTLRTCTTRELLRKASEGITKDDPLKITPTKNSTKIKQFQPKKLFTKDLNNRQTVRYAPPGFHNSEPLGIDDSVTKLISYFELKSIQTNFCKKNFVKKLCKYWKFRKSSPPPPSGRKMFWERERFHFTHALTIRDDLYHKYTKGQSLRETTEPKYQKQMIWITTSTKNFSVFVMVIHMKNFFLSNEKTFFWKTKMFFRSQRKFFEIYQTKRNLTDHTCLAQISFKLATGSGKFLTLMKSKSPPPSKIFGDFTDGSVCHRFPLHMMAKIRKKQNFVILCGIYFPWYVHFVFAWMYTLSIFPDIHCLNENDTEKWSSEHLFRVASKKFLRTGKSKYFRRGGN